MSDKNDKKRSVKFSCFFLAFPPTDVGLSELSLDTSSSPNNPEFDGYSPSGEKEEDDDKIRLLECAVEVHSKHCEISDEGGRFVALTNLGLCNMLLNRFKEAAHAHQQALRVSINMNSIYGQAISVGNLGLLALKEGNFEISKSCLEQHLQLVQVKEERFYL